MALTAPQVTISSIYNPNDFPVVLVIDVKASSAKLTNGKWNIITGNYRQDMSAHETITNLTLTCTQGTDTQGPSVAFKNVTLYFALDWDETLTSSSVIK